MDYRDFYNDLYESNLCGIVQLGLPLGRKCRLHRFNRKAADILGLSQGDVQLNTVSYLNEDNYRYFRNALRGIEDGRKRSFLIQLIKGTLEGEARQLKTPEGDEVIEFDFLEIGREIAVRKREAVQKELLESVLQSVNCGVLRFGFLGGEQCINIVNEAGWKMLGFTNEEECVRQGIDGFLPRIAKEDRGAFLKAHCSLNNKNRTASSEFRITDLQGEVRWLSAEEQTLWDAKRNYMVQITLSDITDEKLLSQQKDRESEEIIQALGVIYNTVMYVDVKKDAYRVIKDPFNKFTNGEHCYSADLAQVTRHLEKLNVSAEDMSLINLESCCKRYLNGEKVYEHDFPVAEQDGQTKYYRIEAIFMGGEELEHITFGIRDVTGLRSKEMQAQEMLRASYEAAKQANEAKTDFFSRMSHDIRTPMNAIVGLTQIMANHIDDRQRIEDCIGKIDESSQMLLELINEVLDMSRVEQGKMKIEQRSVSLGDLIEKVKNIVQPEMDKHMHNFVVVNNLEQDSYLADPLRLQQILMNLLSNAVKFTHDGGRIEFRCEREQTSANTCDVKFVVSDNGIGMSKEFLSKLYKPFERGNNEEVSRIQGTGLGMSIVSNLVGLMNGRIDVESEEGEGTTFCITLPMKIAEEKAEENTVVRKAAKPDLSGRHILIVEDNQINMIITNEIIKDTGAEIDNAFNGAEAVEKFEKSAVGYYDLILMDVKMPVMDGYTATKKIRDLDRKDAGTVPVFAMTANAFAEDVHDALNAGMNCHLSKPVKLDDLYREINCYLS